MTKKSKPTVNLSDEDGNVFFIIARCRRILRDEDYTEEQIQEFTREMQSGNYDHALQTVFRWFEVE